MLDESWLSAAVGGVGSTPGEAAGGAPGAGAGLGDELVETPGGIEAPPATPTLRLGPGRHQRTLGRVDNCHDAVLGQEAQCGGAVHTPVGLECHPVAELLAREGPHREQRGDVEAAAGERPTAGRPLKRKEPPARAGGSAHWMGR